MGVIANEDARLMLHLRHGVGPAPLICISQRLPLSMRTSPTLAERVSVCDLRLRIQAASNLMALPSP